MIYKKDPITEKEKLKTLRISPSSINTFNQCPRKWYYDYIEAIPPVPTIHLVRGNIVHNTLEEIFKARYYPTGEQFRITMMNYGMKLFNEFWKKDIQQITIEEDKEEQYYTESKLMVERFINKFCDNIQDGIQSKKFTNENQGYYFTRPIFKELWLDDEKIIQFDEKWKRKFIKKENLENFDNPLYVGGFVDSVQKNFDNEFVLVDYKTSNKYKNVLSSDYVLQLGIYAYLWEKQTGSMPSFVAINYLKFSESYYIKVTTNLIKWAKQQITNMRNNLFEYELEKENYFKKESKLCDWCQHKDKCLK